MARRLHPGRLDAVEAALAAMESTPAVEERLAKEWGCSPRQVRRYIAAVSKRWAERASATTEARRAELSEMALDVYREARRKGHARVALQCITQLAELHGVTHAQVGGAMGLAIYTETGVLTNPQAITDRLRELRRLELSRGPDDDEGGGGGGN